MRCKDSATRRLTDLLYGEVRALCFQLLVHGIPKDDPAVHGTRCLLDTSFHLARPRRHWTGGGLLNGGHWLVPKLCDLVLWHLNDRLTAVAVGRECEGERLSHLLRQALLEILQQQIAEQLLYVALEKHNTVAIAPAVHAGVQRALKLRHSVQVCGGGER